VSLLLVSATYPTRLLAGSPAKAGRSENCAMLRFSSGGARRLVAAEHAAARARGAAAARHGEADAELRARILGPGGDADREVVLELVERRPAAPAGHRQETGRCRRRGCDESRHQRTSMPMPA
jgi:hypothetical protein